MRDASKWIKVGSQKGSNPGGTYRDEENNHHYVKTYDNDQQARTEHVTNQIYRHLGINTPKTQLVHQNGKIALASEYNSSLNRMDPDEFHQTNIHQARQLARMYHGATLTNNYDIVGLEHDNILKDHQGNLHSIDQGGSMHFRAQGKPKDFGHDIELHKSLRNPQYIAGKVFAPTFMKYPSVESDTIHSLNSLKPEHVHKMFADAGVHNGQQHAETILARKKKILDHYGVNEQFIPKFRPFIDGNYQ